MDLERIPSRSLWKRLFSWRGDAADPLPPNVDVVACSPVDLCATEFTPTHGFVLLERLDAAWLKGALFRAVEEKLPRAGARLALRKGVYEFHVPHAFSDGIPPVQFTHTDHPEDAFLTHAAIPPRLPDGLREPCWADMADCVALFRAPGTPGYLQDFLRPGTPLVHVHVTTFRDATLIGITASHVMFDAHGTAALCDAWTAVLRGELDTVVASPRDFRPFTEILRDPPKLHAPLELGWFSRLRSLVRFVLWSWAGRTESSKLLYVPHTWLAARKSECMAELEARGSNEWVGSSDVLTASILKMIYAHRSGDPQKIHLYMPVSLRRLFPAEFKYPYPNAIGICEVTPIAAGDIAAQPLLETALAVRRSLIAFTSPSGLDVVRGQLAWKERYNAGKKGRLFAPNPDAEYALLSNWRSAKFNQFDFSGAQKGRDKDLPGAVTPVFVGLFVQDGIQVPMRGIGAVLSETDNGIWATMTLNDEEWESLKANNSLLFV
ncbi:hypothetical protein AURDEDRAFT_160350 [Auricularia subglabra TFB-10046 SS5]|nr:hypothetical protein AURDEDRAFT_160350 [Auricularia subglabra TFB-10046 SS5]